MATAMQEETVVVQQEALEEAIEEDYYVLIDKIQEFGVNVADIQKLKAAGLLTVNRVQMTTKKKLEEIRGISEAKIEKILEACNKIHPLGFRTGCDVARARDKIIKVSTGSKMLDNLLGGGIESQALTEVFGEFRTGKTQLALTMCVTAQLPLELGGGNGKVIYIDTENTFRPDRIRAIAERYNVNPDECLENITYARAFTHEHQMHLLDLAAAKMMEEHHSLIIVDSVTALFRVEFMGRGQLADRQQKLGQFLSALTKISEEFNVAVYYTNQVVSDPGAGAMFVADAKKPIGGHIMAHASTTRLYLRKGRGEQRICKIYDSPSLPEAECVFQLCEGGVTDVKE